MKFNILFVCLGNICRSPSAEAVFRGFVKEKGEDHKFEIDSAGTYGYHEGEPADARMQTHALKRGYNLTSISRAFNPTADWDKFDYIVAMDNSNLRNLSDMARNSNDLTKLCKITDFSNNFNHQEVPDPYYGGDQGFELVLDILEDASHGFHEFIRK
ncbi:MAG: low molecular weight phosphotyrosine protein phosphatase [Lentimicrobiaceae bacterium]|jgi:protein-tyrosine phosphatase|nr:low molecular weight phosphotyrosine protein phosphatase [Lentimicrobiaceae bacterium]MBT3455154.1 low molecular weight phosphotyrosine protein phosphatase [Lentimicrobiaceae bacterium]MBT4468462.1 low molecular weight phosphotyrosine protein phosphatase [Lentimicrobiaceae bacterium]MBT4801484.1 low molecular weight phosphotyrosine protein phosphatase [Lentimicrobiaceae bacterium]MBT5162855.1 low molecular weight phosphotyrosine protein phosphatase [Lentimicrobiaceae bacterium]